MYLRFVRFKDLSQWDVKRFWDNLNVLFSNSVRLKDILSPHFEPVSKEEMLNKQWHNISKINFSGKLFLRDVLEAKTFKGNLNKIDSNTLIYSKINIKHGCIYFHPDNTEPFGVSSEYPAYKIDASKVSGAYLVKVMQSQYFKTLLNKKTSGISKSRVKPDEFLSIIIPLPPLKKQQALIKAYNDKILKAETFEKQATKIENDIDIFLNNELGLNANRNKDTLSTDFHYMHFIRFKDIERWDGKQEENISGFYKLLPLGKLCLRMATGTTPPTSKKEFFNGNIKFYTPADITDKMYLENSERYISEKAITEKKARTFHKGDLLFVGIGSTVGKVGIVNDDIVSANQQITGITLDRSLIMPEYAFCYMNSNKAITTAEQSKSTLPIINQEKISRIPIPIPPLSIQKKIVEHILSEAKKKKQLKQQAEALRKKALEEFEKEVFE